MNSLALILDAIPDDIDLVSAHVINSTNNSTLVFCVEEPDEPLVDKFVFMYSYDAEGKLIHHELFIVGYKSNKLREELV